MKTMNNVAVTALLLALAQSASADPTAPDRPIYGHADQCYWETVKIRRGAQPEELSTLPCKRALRDRPLRPRDKSIVLYNRGVIERAQGDTEAARASFEKAVDLSRTVDMRNLALAQLAHRQGDYAVAIEQYELLLTATDAGPRVLANGDIIRRNLALATEAERLHALRARASSSAEIGD